MSKPKLTKSCRAEEEEEEEEDIVSLVCSVASDSRVYTICCDAKECQNTNLLRTICLCKGLSITVEMMMMMEIIMNPTSVPKSTAQLGFDDIR